MPCDCGPDVRTLWEKVRDLMRHHDETADRLRESQREAAVLREENKTLRGVIADQQLRLREAPDAD